MCLILFAVEPNPEYRLIVAANRDEFYSRVAEPAELWPDESGVLGGRDQGMGGTWLGINHNGRFAAVTNFKEEPPQPLPPLSRGALPLGFLTGKQDPATYSQAVSEQAEDYRGFNLLIADQNGVAYYCNRQIKPKVLGPGFYGLSNQALDCNWPKVTDGRIQLEQLVQQEQSQLPESLFKILMSSGDDREFSNSFIRGEEYGTRAATVVLIKRNSEIFFEERTFGAGGTPLGDSSFVINYTAGS